MVSEIVCPSCGARYRPKAEIPRGRQLKCAKCGSMIASDLYADTLAGVGAERVPEPECPLAGKVIGGCRVESKLGQGGMGAVYKARHLALDIDVALKILPPHVAKRNPKFAERFIREARAAAKLHHQNIVGVMNVGKDKGVYYIVMQYVDGGSVQDRLALSDRIAVDESLRIVKQVCAALDMAHRNQVVHRDIKPDNIMITADGVVKLADLGLARTMGEDSGLTLSGTGLGTPYFMAPEQCRDARNADHRSDLYSLGCTWYRMVTGQLPFEGPSGFAVMMSHTKNPVPDARDVRADIPDTWLWPFASSWPRRRRTASKAPPNWPPPSTRWTWRRSWPMRNPLP